MFEVELSPGAFKDLRRLQKSHKAIAERIVHAIDRLRTTPELGKPLLGNLAAFRSLRVGDYRILYTIDAWRILVQITKIAHRREVYR